MDIGHYLHNRKSLFKIYKSGDTYREYITKSYKKRPWRAMAEYTTLERAIQCAKRHQENGFLNWYSVDIRLL